MCVDDDFFILGSDGIFDKKSEQWICEFIQERLSTGHDLISLSESFLDLLIAENSNGFFLFFNFF